MSVMIIGGSGRLGKQLQKLNPQMLVPTREQLDVTRPATIDSYLDKHKPTVVIHAAAVTENLLVEADPTDAIQVNIVGTANVALACLKRRIRLVYISTDYIYKGDHGNYQEKDEILPSNAYAWTKLGGEASARLVPNHVIIRTSFGVDSFPYSVAFEDKWTSKDYIDRIAPMIYDAALSPITGILNLGTERKTLYDYASERNKHVKPIRLGESAFATPYDTSLNLERWLSFQSQRPIARSLKACRACSSDKLEVYLDLGLMPLANNLATTAKDGRLSQRFPLQVMLCQSCFLSQLSVVVDPNVLFGYYTYRSSINPSFVKHCRSMAASLKKQLGLEANDLVVDIAGNDGTLLKQFKAEIGCKVLNIEPAGNIAAIAAADGIATINEFWSSAVIDKVISKHQRPKLITATNVWAHVDDIGGFLTAAKSCLDPAGAIVLEFPYLADLIEKNEFDTVYFEHLSYLLIAPVAAFARQLGMTLTRVEKQEIHGGSVRVFISPNANAVVDKSVNDFCGKEESAGLHGPKVYGEWSNGVYSLISSLNEMLTGLKRSGAKIAAFGASAKGNTLLNSCRLTTDTITYIVDDTPEKIGKYSPGTGIPIVNRSELYKNKPDYLVVLAWNFLDDVMKSTVDYGNAGGKYILPIPTPVILENRYR
jgi:dTDP-4-dehydrorhamnose reductase